MNLKPAVHTPTPWSIGTIDIYAHGGFRVASCNMTDDLMLAKANAAFIVRAVNGFKALEEENTRLRNERKELINALYRIIGSRDPTTMQKYAQEAVAQAEGK